MNDREREKALRKFQGRMVFFLILFLSTSLIGTVMAAISPAFVIIGISIMLGGGAIFGLMAFRYALKLIRLREEKEEEEKEREKAARA